MGMWEGMGRLRAAVMGVALLSAGAVWADQAATDSSESNLQPVLMGEAPAPQRSWVDDVKNPVPWFRWGFDQRNRWEHIQNPFLIDTDPPGHVWSFIRERSRLWGTVSPMDGVDINGRLTWEWRYWFTPESKDEWDWGNAIPDQLNVRVKLKEVPLTVTAGRQDIILGDGWLVLDGTPLDGSTTIFFDAARATLELKECQTAIDGIFIYQFSSPDEWLGPIASHHNPLIEQNETGAILWVTNKSIQNTEIDGYFMYKHDDKLLANGDEGDIYTAGLRAVHKFNDQWMISGEGAYQFGDKNNADLSAFGGKGRLTYFFQDRLKNQVHVGTEFLSGDDPNSKTNEQWDPLWGRWPQFSELYVYTYAVETRIADVTNLFRLNAGWQADPTDKLMVKADYNALFAPENIHAGSPGFSESGSFRGHLFTGVVGYKFNKNLVGQLVGEVLLPGDYYQETDGVEAFDTRRDYAAYSRIELIWTF